MLRDGKVIGVIFAAGSTSVPFSDKEVDAPPDVRRPGGDRDRERASVQRDEGGAGAADRHGRGAAGDQQLGRRHRPVFEKILDSCRHLFATEQVGIFLVGTTARCMLRAWRARRWSDGEPFPEAAGADA